MTITRDKLLKRDNFFLFSNEDSSYRIIMFQSAYYDEKTKSGFANIYVGIENEDMKSEFCQKGEYQKILIEDSELEFDYIDMTGKSKEAVKAIQDWITKNESEIIAQTIWLSSKEIKNEK